MYWFVVLMSGPEWQLAQKPWRLGGTNGTSMKKRRPRFSESVLPRGSVGVGPPEAYFLSVFEEKSVSS